MKSFISLIVFAALLFCCEKNSSDFELNKVSVSLVALDEGLSGEISERVLPSGPPSGRVEYYTEDPYVASIENWTITAHHVGQTFAVFTDGVVTLVCRVSVRPIRKYNLEPILDFSLAKSDIIQKISPDADISDGGDYITATKDRDKHRYNFVNGHLSSVEVDYADMRNIYLRERYDPYNGSESVYVDRDGLFVVEKTKTSHIYTPLHN